MALKDSFTDFDGTGVFGCYGTRWYMQTFTTTSAYTITDVELNCWKYGSPGDITVGIREVVAGKPVGDDLCSVTVADSEITTLPTLAYYKFTFDTSYTLADATQYAIVARAPSGDAGNYFQALGYDSSGYAGGGSALSTDSGNGWGTVSTTRDANFKTYGETLINVRSIHLGSAGNFLVATAETGIYLSTDFGDNWTRKTPDGVEDTDWIKGICSSDGTYIIVVSSANTIYRSANSGTSWAAITPAGEDTFSVNDLATSDDGQFMVIVGQNTTDPTKSCYISSDYGVTWTAKYPLSDFFLSNTASDIDGKYYMYPEETGEAESELNSSALEEGVWQLIFSYLSEVGKPGIHQLEKDTYDLYARLKVGTESKSTSVQWRLSKVNSDGKWGRTTLIAASEATGELTDTTTSYKISGILSSTFPIETSDRLLLELYANVGATGNPSIVTITMEGDYNSHFTVASPIEWTECDISNDGAVIAVSTSSYFYISFDSGATWLEQGMASSVEVWEGLSISGDGTTGLIANTNDNNEFFIGTNTELYSEATWAESDLTSAGRAILDDADAPAQATTLGLGTGDSPTWVGATFSGLTASKLVASNGSKGLESVSGTSVHPEFLGITIKDSGDAIIFYVDDDEMYFTGGAIPIADGMSIGLLLALTYKT